MHQLLAKARLFGTRRDFESQFSLSEAVQSDIEELVEQLYPKRKDRS